MKYSISHRFDKVSKHVLSSKTLYLMLKQSEDIRLLKEELRRGLENLDKVAELRDECSKLSWKKEIDDMKKCSRFVDVYVCYKCC